MDRKTTTATTPCARIGKLGERSFWNIFGTSIPSLIPSCCKTTQACVDEIVLSESRGQLCKLGSLRRKRNLPQGINTCSTSSTDGQASKTLPGPEKQARLSTWPLVSSSAIKPLGSQITFEAPVKAFKRCSISPLLRLGFLFSCSKHSSVVISVLQTMTVCEQASGLEWRTRSLGLVWQRMYVQFKQCCKACPCSIDVKSWTYEIVVCTAKQATTC